MLSDLILYQYALSPFSEKIRAMAGYCGVSWCAVDVTSAPPRPELLALTGGYRKIPVAQIGADVFCDTRTIARELERLSGKTGLDVAQADDEVKAFVKRCDLELFFACLIGSSNLRSLWNLLKATSLTETVRFFGDRIAMGRKAKVQAPSPGKAKKLLDEHLHDLSRRLENYLFLFGEEPCIADFSAYHGLWYVREVSGRNLKKDFPAVEAWMDRIRNFGHGARETITADQALDVAQKAKPRAVAKDYQAVDGSPGMNTRVTIAPSDYGRDPVRGWVVGSGEHEWVIAREDSRVGLVHVHFPTEGFRVREDS